MRYVIEEEVRPLVVSMKTDWALISAYVATFVVAGLAITASVAFVYIVVVT